MKAIILSLLSAVVYAANECDNMRANPSAFGLKSGGLWYGSDAASEGPQNCIAVFEQKVKLDEATKTCKEQLESQSAKDKYIVRLAWIKNAEKAKLIKDNMHGKDKTGQYKNTYYIGLKSTLDDINNYKWYNLNNNDEEEYIYSIYPPQVTKVEDFGQGNIPKEYMIVSMDDITQWTRAFGNYSYGFVCEILPKNKCEEPIDCTSSNIFKTDAAKFHSKDGLTTCIGVFEDNKKVEGALQSCQDKIADSAKSEYGARLVWIKNKFVQDLIKENKGANAYYFFGLKSSSKTQQTKENYYWFNEVNDARSEKNKFNFGIDFDQQYTDPSKFVFGDNKKEYMVLSNKDMKWTKAYGNLLHGYVCEIYRKGCY